MKEEVGNRQLSSGFNLDAITLKRRTFMMGAAASAIGLTFGPLIPKAFAAAGHLEILGWEGSDGKTEATPWLKKNDITANITFISTQDDVTARLAGANPVQQDLATYALGYEKIYQQLGILTPIDTSKMSNYSKDSIFPFFYQAERWYWDGQQWAVPYIWGINTIIYNPKKIKQPNRYKDLLAPELKGKLTFTDDTLSTWPIIAKIAGYGDQFPNLTHAQFEDAFEKLAPYKDQCRVFATSSGDAVSLLVSGEVDAVFSTSAYTPFDTAKSGVETRFHVPEEGAATWCDAWFVPKTVKSRELAVQYINQMLDPQVQANLCERMSCGTVNPKAVAHLKPEIRALWDYNNLESFFERSKFYGQPPTESSQYVTYAEWLNKWTEFKGSF